MITRRLFAGGSLALPLAGCGRQGLGRLMVGETGRVVEVRSGHAVMLDTGLAVRLAGIEAPALSQTYGREAREALLKLVLGKEVELLYGGRRRDRYERAIAHLRLNKGGRWIQRALLDAGTARVRTWSDNRALAGEMLEAEAGARAEKAGLWALHAYSVFLPSEAGRLRGFHIVEGRVARLGLLGNRRYLDLEGGVRVDIPLASVEDFAAAGRDLGALIGRLVRVRGVLDAAMLRIDHPEALEVLRSR